MAENDGKVVFELDVDDSQVQDKIDRAIEEMRRAVQSGKNALLSLDADTVAALARLHRVQAESSAARSIVQTDTGTTPGGARSANGHSTSDATAQPSVSRADESPAALGHVLAGQAEALTGAVKRAAQAAFASSAASPIAAAQPPVSGAGESPAALSHALAEAAERIEQVATSASGMDEACASAAETLAGQAETMARQTEALTGQADAAQGTEAAMRSTWASMSLVDGAAAGLRTSILAARDAAGGISSAISGLISRIRSGTTGASGGGAGTNRLSKYAVGLDVVPYDDYPALLHRGEMVLNAAEASAYRMGGGRDTGGTGIDYDRLARAMANVSLEMDGQKVGRLVERSVSAAQSYRYHRAARKG